MSKHGDYIARLKAALLGHLKGQQGLSAVESALDELLTHNSQKIPQARKLLANAGAAGLNAEVVRALTAKIDSQRSELNEVAFAETVVMPSGMTTASPGEALTPEEPEDSEEPPTRVQTVVLPGVRKRRAGRGAEEIDDLPAAADDEAQPTRVDTIVLPRGRRGSDRPIDDTPDSDDTVVMANAAPGGNQPAEGGDTAGASGEQASEYLDTVVMSAPPSRPVTPAQVESPSETTAPGAGYTDTVVLQPGSISARHRAAADQENLEEAKAAAPEATVMRAETTELPPAPDADVTHVGRPSPNSESSPDQADATVMGDDPDRTTLHEPIPHTQGEGHERAPDATELDAGDANRTMLGPAADEDDPDATKIRGDAHASTTEVPGSRGTDRTTGATFHSGASRTTEPPAGHRASDDAEIGAGHMLRQRFELASKLGEGGMGAVWRGKDLLKVEARDRNPWVAIKLLQGDFKQHPEAFIALQRETSKQQRLAHPNIATVYDFDRDTDTDTVFMTMEVLEGEDLASFIRKLPSDGLSLEEAMPYIEQLCAGLSYAHEADLVHSDLKPGNCFVTGEGRIKLLDFGIARASQTKADAAGEVTVFDPGSLGALTPTYATVEMFDGKDPDPRDDIYALAIMAYQLLTGKHPYGKLSAPKAMKQGLSPAPVSKLDKRQNRALQKSLEFLRENRTASVEEFLDGIRPKKSYAWQITAGSVLLLGLIGALAYQPINQYLTERRVEEAIAAFDTIDDADHLALSKGVATIQSEFDDAVERTVLDDLRVKQKLMTAYDDLVNSTVAADDGEYDYARAFELLRELETWYPDSAERLRKANEVQRRMETELGRLGEKYEELLAAGRLIPLENEDDISDVLHRVRQIDPSHVLLNDKELPLRYADLVQLSVDENEFERADEFLQASREYAENDATLVNLRFTVESELKRQRDARLVAEIEQRLGDQKSQLTTLDDFRSARDDLVKLSDIDSGSDLVSALTATLKASFEAKLQALTADGRWSEAEQLLFDFARLLDIPYLESQRQTLSSAETQAGHVVQDSDSRRQAIDERTTRIGALLDDPLFTDTWERELRVPYKELLALLPWQAGRMTPLKTRTAQLYLDAATDARQANRLNEATALVETGLQFHPELVGFVAELEAIADARLALERQQAEERRLARVRKLRASLIADTKADKPQQAAKKLTLLREELPGDDTFVSAEAPQQIAAAYQRLSLQQAEQKNWENAARLALAGLDLVPDLPDLAAEYLSYKTEVEKTQSIVELRQMLSSANPIDFGSVATRVEGIKAEFPDRWPQLQSEYEAIVQKRLRALERTDVAAAHAMRASALPVFPAIAKVRLAPLPSKLAARVQSELASGKLTAARATLNEAIAVDGADHPDIAPLRRSLDEREAKADTYYKEALKQQQRKQIRKAQQYLVQGAMKLWADNPRYENLLAELSAAGTGGGPKKGACTPDKAGHGTRSRGTCYDELDGNARGPILVVVPPPGGTGEAFAIGKFEVSVGDYNLYCGMSGKCTPLPGDKKLPVTGVSVQQAEAYAGWLSSRSGASYRLPTGAEWEHAALAGGKQPKKDFNCRVLLGDQVLKGHGLVNAASGRQNGWGLANYVGNAQEWVKSGGAIQARGAAFEDSLSKCDLSVSKTHSGAADALTGFRLLRELD